LSTGNDLIGAPEVPRAFCLGRGRIGMAVCSLRSAMSHVLGLALHQAADNVAKLQVGLERLEAAVEPDRRLDIAVSQHSADGFVVARVMFEPDGGRGVSELVHRQTKSSRRVDAARGLVAEGLWVLVSPGLPRE